MNHIFKFRVHYINIITILLSFFAINDLIAQDVIPYTRYTNLPTIYIETANKVNIVSKTTYVYATMWYIDENDEVTRYDSLQIRGRGNSTWDLQKKPYRIKFPKKEKFLGKGYAKAKSWTLLANAGDKTMMRNAVTSSMAQFMGMDFCPAYKFIDLNLNGTYLGTYQISDQVEVRSHRVDIIEQDYPLSESSDITGGYLLEVDGFKEKNYFTTTNGVAIRIHYPDEEEIVASQNTYIRTFIRNFEGALFGRTFTDPIKGYRTWVDSTSLAHLVIGNEVAANIDAYWSTYFYKQQQDPLIYWGPLWDYDIAYDNDYRIQGTVNKLMHDVGYGDARVWIKRMWEDPWFVRLIHRRYSELINNGLVSHMHSTIDSLANLINDSQELNYQKWGINKKMYHEIILYSSYDQYLTDLRNFITAHTKYLSRYFESKLPEGDKNPTESTSQFKLEDYYYRISNKGASTLLDAVDNLICGWKYSASRISQEWEIKQVGDYYHLTNRSNVLSLNDPTIGNVGATINVGTQLNTVEADTLDDRQLWSIIPQGSDGYYNLINKYTGHTANLNGGGSSNNTPIISYTTDDRNATSNNRLWLISKSNKLQLPEVNSIQVVEPEEYALAYNPTTQELHFGAANSKKLNFTASLHDTSGRQLLSFRADEHCSVAHLPAGIYIIVWKCGGYTRSTKFAKR